MTVAVLAERPFAKLRRLEVDWDKAPSIAEILDAQADLSDSFRRHCVARVIDEIVPREMWRHVRPKPGPCIRNGNVIDVVVTFTLPLGNPGGSRSSGGGKNTIATVASIAVLLAATVVSAGTLLPALGPLTAAQVSALAGTGIAIGGTLAIAALIPPPSLRANQSVVSNDAGTNAAASLTGNVLSKGSPVPRVIGTHRIFPPIISPELIEIVGDSTVAEAVFGLAGPHALSDILIGKTTADSIPDLDTEIQEGLPNSPVLGLVTRQSFTDASASQVLTQHVVDNSSGGGGINLLNQTDYTQSEPQWTGLTSRLNPDEIWLHLNFIAGLVDNANNRQGVAVRVRMRQVGAASWINLPEVQVVRQAQAPFQCAIKLMFEAALPTNTALSNYDSGGPVRCYTSVPTQSVNPIGIGGWTADSYFYNGSGDTYLHSGNVGGTSGVINTNLYLDRAEFYLSGAKFPAGQRWEIQIIRGQAFRDAAFTRNTYVLSPGNVYDFFGYLLFGGGVAQTIQDQRTLSQTCELIRFISVWNTPPVPNPAAFAVIAAKVTNRSINQLSVLASGYVKDWDGSGWNTITTTSNPAPHLYDVYTGTLGGSPLPAEIVDSAGLVAFRTHCQQKGYTCNAIVEGKTYLDVATMIAACGFAKPLHSELWGVAVDQDTTGFAPVQVFTPRNLRQFSWSKAFPRLPTGIRASFNDASNDYQPTEIVVFADANNPDSSRLEQIAYDGLVDSGVVSNRAAFDLLQMQLRLTFYKGTADAESIVCQKGDLVGLQHDTFDGYAGFARIASVFRSGGLITGLSLDGGIFVNTGVDIITVTDVSTVADVADLGAQTGLMIRLKGGNGILTTGAVSTDDSANDSETTVNFVTPLADPGTSQLDVGCLVTSGRLGSEYRRMKVFGMVPKTDRTADLIFVDEAPSLWALAQQSDAMPMGVP